MIKTRNWRLIEYDLGCTLQEHVKRETEQGKSVSQIAMGLGISRNTLDSYLAQLGAKKTFVFENELANAG